MAPFYEWGSTPSRLVQLRGGSLLFTTKFPYIKIKWQHFYDDTKTNLSITSHKNKKQL